MRAAAQVVPFHCFGAGVEVVVAREFPGAYFGGFVGLGVDGAFVRNEFQLVGFVF